MRMMALDLSMARTGWAFAKGGQIVGSGSAERKPGAGEGEGKRLLAMDRELTSILETWKPELVIFPEFYGTQNAEAARASLGLRGVLLRRCEVLGIKTEAKNENTARKKMGVDLSKKLTGLEQLDYERRLGKRKSTTKGTTRPKRDMKERVAEVLTKLGIIFADNDEADALIMALANIKESE